MKSSNVNFNGALNGRRIHTTHFLLPTHYICISNGEPRSNIQFLLFVSHVHHIQLKTVNYFSILWDTTVSTLLHIIIDYRNPKVRLFILIFDCLEVQLQLSTLSIMTYTYIYAIFNFTLQLDAYLEDSFVFLSLWVTS